VVKILFRVGAALGGLLVLLLVAAVVLLPRVLQSAAVRSQVEAAAESALGRDVSLGALDVGLLPPSLLVAETRVAGPSPDADPLLEAREVALRLALLPLIAGTVLVDSLVIDGATLNLVRSVDGVDLPSGSGDGDPKPEADESGGPPMTLAVREVALTNAILVLDDRAVKPPTRTRIGADVMARGSALDAPIDLDVRLGLGDEGAGGEVLAKGTATLAGALDLDVDIRSLALAPLASYAGDSITSLSGLLDGRVELEGPAANPNVTADLGIYDSVIEASGASVRGPIRLSASLQDAVEALAGPFEVDVGDAHVRYGDVLDKAPGRALSASGRLVPGRGAPSIQDLKVVLANLEAVGQLQLDPALRLDLRTNAADLTGWEDMILPLASAPLQGTVQVESMAVRTEPMALDGRIAMTNLLTELPDRGPVVLNGALLFAGDVITTQDVVAQAADQPFALDARVDDLFGTLRYQAEVTTQQADVNALASSFAGKPDTLIGPLNLSGRFHGTVERGKSPLETLKAELDFDIARGRLVGLSILEAVMGQLGSVAIEAGNLFVGPELQRFYGEEFEIMKGELRLDGGVGHSKPLSIQYRDYGVELIGEIDIATLSVDMEGRVTLYETIDAIIAEKAGAPDDYAAQRRDIPLAAVEGSLDAPKVKLARDSAASFATAYATDIYGEKVRAKIDKKLGQGAAKVVEEGLGALEGLFGGGKKK
jgi:AsmA protein